MKNKGDPGGFTESYLSQYIGKTAEEVLASDKIKKNPNLDAVTGATVSCDGVFWAVSSALEQFELVKEEI